MMEVLYMLGPGKVCAALVWPQLLKTDESIALMGEWPRSSLETAMPGWSA